jgi:DNA-binding transcriptional LysR family regulator
MRRVEAGRMELRHLRTFVVIAEQGSFTRAAEVLSIAQPALTAQMQKLEAEFGTPLFVRTARGVTLTAAGTAALDSARETLRAADGTIRAAQIAAEVAGARINIAYSRTFPVAQLSRMIRGFRRDRPGLRLDVREMWSNNQVEALADGAIDVGFLQLPDDQRAGLAERGITAIKTAEESLLLAVPNSHPLAARRSVTMRDLATESFILPSPTMGESVLTAVIEAARVAGFAPTVVQEVTDIRLLLGLTSAELGVTFVFTHNRDMRLRNVHYLRLTPAITLSFGAIHRRGFGGRTMEPILARIAREAFT